MNTKRHRCRRANIICCNYDNTRVIQDVGIGVGWDAFHQYSNKQSLKRKKIAASRQIFSQPLIGENNIFPFLSYQFMKAKRVQKP